MIAGLAYTYGAVSHGSVPVRRITFATVPWWPSTRKSSVSSDALWPPALERLKTAAEREHASGARDAGRN